MRVVRSFCSVLFLLFIRKTFGTHQRVIVAGASGYVGRNVVKELVARNVPVGALIRNDFSRLPSLTKDCLSGADILYADVLDRDQIDKLFHEFKPTGVVCCLASRSGLGSDAYLVDYQGGLNMLESLANMSSGTQNVHYTLLSAFCCGKPGLQFQFAKLKLESEIIRFSKRSTSNANQTILSYSIVRPTAFFKSLDGQLESARNGKPIIYFGDGSCSANPIGETDLANYLIDCATMPKSINMINEIRNIGGPDVPPITKRQQGEMIYDTLGIPKNKRKFVSVPVKIFDILIGFFTTSQAISTALNKSEWVKRCEDAAELTRIVKYYAVEPMVATGHNEVIGTMKLSDHFKSIAERGGELLEIDRMTTTSGVLSSFANNDI